MRPGCSGVAVLVKRQLHSVMLQDAAGDTQDAIDAALHGDKGGMVPGLRAYPFVRVRAAWKGMSGSGGDEGVE